MAKVNNPLMSLEAHRTVGKQLTARRSRGQNIIGKTPIPSNPQTPVQQEHRDDFQGGVEMWHTLDAAEKEEYRQKDPSSGGPAAYLNYMKEWLMGTVPKHETRHRAGGADAIAGPLDLAAIPTPLTGKDADSIDGYHAITLAKAITIPRPKTAAITTFTIPGFGACGTTASQAVTANMLWYMPIIIWAPKTLDQIALEVTVSGVPGSVARLGVYQADSDFQPTALLQDAGEISVANIGVKTTPLALTLLPGAYLLALQTNQTFSLRRISAAPPFVALHPALGTNPVIHFWRVARAYAALPNPGTPWDTYGQNPEMYHCLFVRESAP